MRSARATAHGSSAAFPIPMRGNEKDVVDPQGEGLFRFPIPMRGNEVAASSVVWEYTSRSQSP